MLCEQFPLKVHAQLGGTSSVYMKNALAVVPSE